MLRTGALAVLVLAAGPACVPDPGRPDRTAATYLRILAAEDARPSGGEELATLIAATDLDHVFLRQTAVRALGRLESPAVVGELTRHLGDPEPAVRAAAAEALAQSVHRSAGDAVLDALLGRATAEDDPEVAGVLARSLGRLRLNGSDRRRVTEALLELGWPNEATASLPTILGVALGFESVVRRSGGEGLSRVAANRLESLLTYGLPPVERRIEAVRVRALALATLGESRRLTLELIRLALGDPEADVRLAAVRHLNAVVPSLRADLIGQALDDESVQVRIEAIRYMAGAPRDELFCRYLGAAAAPRVAPAIRVQALEALSRPCPTTDAQTRTLTETASNLDADSGTGWQPAAQALVSLARIDLDATARLLPRYVQHSNPFVRTHAALAAASLRDGRALRSLAADPSANVRTAAVQGLFSGQGHAIDDLLLGQLSHDDPQLLMTAARLLEESPLGLEAASAALGAFERISRAERETWRDPRRALLERVAELGEVSLAGRLLPFLRDYDATVAGDVAGLLEAWTGLSYEADPQPLPRAALPTVAELQALERTTVELHMRGGGSIVIEMLPYLATTNVFRFVRLARSGYYDGLTFHRWAPNFVIQGGSPGANEYQGDGLYTRDEVGGLAHWRGTVGISTRGHDTGDGQIFINLVDNVRLDHDYTIIGVVIEGLDVVDAVLEGSVIERAEVRVGA